MTPAQLAREERRALPETRDTSKGGARNIDEISPPSTGYNYAAVDFAVDGIAPATAGDFSEMAFALRQSFDWVATGGSAKFNDKGALKRLIAVCWLLKLPCFQGQTIMSIAARYGITPEGINKHVRSLNQRFGVYATGQKPAVRDRDRRRHLRQPGDPSLN